MDVVLLYPVYMQAIRKPDKLKRDALILYVEGLGFRSIGRFLNVSHVTVFNWIKNFGENSKNCAVTMISKLLKEMKLPE